MLFAQLGIALDQERAECALRKRLLASFRINQDAEFHVHVRQLRKRVVVTVERGTAEREQAFFRFGKHVWLQAADFCSFVRHEASAGSPMNLAKVMSSIAWISGTTNEAVSLIFVSRFSS